MIEYLKKKCFYVQYIFFASSIFNSVLFYFSNLYKNWEFYTLKKKIINKRDWINSKRKNKQNQRKTKNLK